MGDLLVLAFQADVNARLHVRLSNEASSVPSPSGSAFSFFRT